MTAGEISGNKANKEDIDGAFQSMGNGGFGGGVYVEAGTFALQGGTVYGNESTTAEAQRDEAYDDGAALYVFGGTATYGSLGTSFGTAPFGINDTITEEGPP
jgi:hypothetical protein